MAVLESDISIRKELLTDSVYQRLVELILQGQLAPGSEFAAQALADRLGVSRTPVTEALRKLAQDGLVEQENYRKTRVVSFSREDVVEIYEIRRALETTAVEKAAVRIDPAQLTDLRNQAEALVADTGAAEWTAQVAQWDAQFHDVLAAASGNQRLQREIARYKLMARCFCRLSVTETRLIEVVQEHMAILAALAARDPAQAREAMARHIDATLEDVLKELF